MYIFKQLPTKTIELEEAKFEQESYLEGFLIEHKELLAFADVEAGREQIKILGRQFTFEENNRIDLLIIEFDMGIPKLRVVELKKDYADIKALEQLKGYIEKIGNEGWEEICKRWGIYEEIKKILQEWGSSEEKVKVCGALVAYEIKVEVKDSLNPGKIQGIEIQRYMTEDNNEAFIFVDYHPEQKDKRLDPTALFERGVIREDDDFYFKDSSGKVHKEVTCRIAQQLGPSNSFMIKIKTIPDGKDEIDYPNWGNDQGTVWKLQKISKPISSKRCATALHRLFEVKIPVEGDPAWNKYYDECGNKNFIRVRDNKTLEELRLEFIKMRDKE